MPPTAQTSAAPRPAPDLGGLWVWALGLLLGLVVLGPGLAGGSLLSLDLLVTPEIPVPNGVFGLGPALSQRVPLFAVLGLGSALVGGPLAIKVFLVLCVAVAFAGAIRLTRLLVAGRPRPPAIVFLAVGALWAAGPFMLTRVGAGHVNLAWAVAVLPWVLPRLCRPADHLPSTFLASAAMALGGPGGGTLGLALAGVALVIQARRGQFLRPALVIGLPHLVWIAPTAVLLWAGAGVSGSGGFATHPGELAGWPALAIGNGFWRGDYQVGARGLAGLFGGVLVLALAWVGGRDLVRSHGWRSWPGSATAAALVGLVLAAASDIPGIRGGYAWLSELPVGAPLRESQRFLALWLVWLAPTLALGAALLVERCRQRWPARGMLASGLLNGALVVAVVWVSVPGWWGIDGRLDPVDYPSGWAQAREVITEQPGTVVAFPWSEYPPLSFAGDRQAFNPVPDYLGGDVLSSYNPVFDPDEARQEQVDRRADVMDPMAEDARAGQSISSDLADLGVRWVVLIHETNWQDYRSLSSDLGLRHALTLPSIDLYEVNAWSGQAVGPDGQGYDLDRPLPPLITTDAPHGSVLNVSGAPGWVQGWSEPVEVTTDGRLRLSGDGGVIWFWPAVPLMVLDLGLLLAVVWAARARKQVFGRILACG